MHLSQSTLAKLAAGGALACAASTASAAPITVLANLDQEVTERQVETADGGTFGAVAYGGNGTATTMNARYNPVGTATAGDGTNTSLNNEFVVVRFDLSGVAKADIASAALKFVLNRTSSNNIKDQRIWGVNAGVANLNTFAEGSAFGSTPGLAADNDITTQSVVNADTTYLGNFNFGTDPGIGATVTINQALLDGSGPADTAEGTIAGYLASLGTGDQAVFLIGGINSSGQLRFNTKEAGVANTPQLVYEVPEPGTLSVLAVGAAAVLRRRRCRRPA